VIGPAPTQELEDFLLRMFAAIKVTAAPAAGALTHADR
jgi:hypothetical protein